MNYINAALVVLTYVTIAFASAAGTYAAGKALQKDDVGRSHRVLQARASATMPQVGKLELASRRRCGFGSLDHVLGDAAGAPGAPLIATLEPATGKGWGPPVWSAPIDALQIGDFEAALRVQGLRMGAVLGLFVCRDRSGTGRCGAKTPLPIAQKPQGFPGPTAPTQAGKDVVYVFQALRWQEGRLEPVAPPPRTSAGLAKLVAAHERLGTRARRAVDTAVRMELSRIDQSLCRKPLVAAKQPNSQHKE